MPAASASRSARRWACSSARRCSTTCAASTRTPARALRKAGIRFGAYHLYLPALLKPAPRVLATQLWALQNGGLEQKGIDEIAHLAQSGRTSIPVDPEIGHGLYRAAGFRVLGGRAVRVDILERLADLIRPAIAYRPGITPGEPPAGAADGEGFVPTVAMTSLVGCAGEDFATILKSLGYVMDRRPGPAITVPLVEAPKPVEPQAAPAEGEAAAPAEEAPAETSGGQRCDRGGRRRGRRGSRGIGRPSRRWRRALRRPWLRPKVRLWLPRGDRRGIRHRDACCRDRCR